MIWIHACELSKDKKAVRYDINGYKMIRTVDGKCTKIVNGKIVSFKSIFVGGFTDWLPYEGEDSDSK